MHSRDLWNWLDKAVKKAEENVLVPFLNGADWFYTNCRLYVFSNAEAFGTSPSTIIGPEHPLTSWVSAVTGPLFGLLLLGINSVQAAKAKEKYSTPHVMKQLAKLQSVSSNSSILSYQVLADFGDSNTKTELIEKLKEYELLRDAYECARSNFIVRWWKWKKYHSTLLPKKLIEEQPSEKDWETTLKARLEDKLGEIREAQKTSLDNLGKEYDQKYRVGKRGKIKVDLSYNIYNSYPELTVKPLSAEELSSEEARQNSLQHVSRGSFQNFSSPDSPNSQPISSPQGSPELQSIKTAEEDVKQSNRYAPPSGKPGIVSSVLESLKNAALSFWIGWAFLFVLIGSLTFPPVVLIGGMAVSTTIPLWIGGAVATGFYFFKAIILIKNKMKTEQEKEKEKESEKEKEESEQENNRVLAMLMSKKVFAIGSMKTAENKEVVARYSDNKMEVSLAPIEDRKVDSAAYQKLDIYKKLQPYRWREIAAIFMEFVGGYLTAFIIAWFLGTLSVGTPFAISGIIDFSLLWVGSLSGIIGLCFACEKGITFRKDRKKVLDRMDKKKDELSYIASREQKIQEKQNELNAEFKKLSPAAYRDIINNKEFKERKYALENGENIIANMNASSGGMWTLCKKLAWRLFYLTCGFQSAYFIVRSLVIMGSLALAPGVVYLGCALGIAYGLLRMGVYCYDKATARQLELQVQNPVLGKEIADNKLRLVEEQLQMVKEAVKKQPAVESRAEETSCCFNLFKRLSNRVVPDSSSSSPDALAQPPSFVPTRAS